MEKKYLFKTLASREKALTINPALAGLLANSFDEVFVPDANGVGAVQKHYLVTEVAYCYQHFGFTLFAPAARALLVPVIAGNCGVMAEPVAIWLESVCYFLLEDFNILRLVEGEPEWSSVDSAFFRDFVRRVICAEQHESGDLGLDCWDAELLERLRTLASDGLEFAKPEGLVDLTHWVNAQASGLPFADDFAKAFVHAFKEIAANPLRLLVWRVESFSSFGEVRQEAKFFVRDTSEVVERKAYQYAALLSLFLPHRAPDGTLLLPESPLTLVQLGRVLKTQKLSTWFDCSLLAAWLNLGETQGPANVELGVLVRQAVSMGFLFEVPLGKRQKGLGLTKSALKILEPFHSAITASVVLQDQRVAPTPTPTRERTEIQKRAS